MTQIPNTISVTVSGLKAQLDGLRAETVGPVTASTQLVLARGSVVLQDDFRHAHSWSGPRDDTASTTFQYGPGGYTIGSLTGVVEHLANSPNRSPSEQLSMSVTAVQTGAPSGAGFGVTCRRGTGVAQVTYTFTVLNTGRFLIERFDGLLNGISPVVVRRGQSPVMPGTTPLTIVGMCATLADGRTTRLALFAGGSLLADVTDVARLSGTGWLGGIDMASGKTPSTMTASSWSERDLSR